MFKVSLSELILIYISLPLIILFILWFLKERKNSKHLNISDNSEEFILECPYCGNVYIDTNQIKDVSQCLVCNNYFKKKGKLNNK